MTAYNPASDLPTGIYGPVTVEEQLVWSNQVLQFNNPTAAYTEAQGSALLFHHISPEIRIPDGRLVIICRNVLQVNEAADQVLPKWKRVMAFSDTVIPAGFKITG